MTGELPPLSRATRLAARVRWLDRYRRRLAIAVSAAISPFLIAQIGDLLGADWPGVHATALAVTLGVIVWWVVELCLVYVTALWETEHASLVRSDGLPRASVHRPRR